MSVDFVMPVRNEGPNIARALAELYEKVPIDKRVLIVYDSEDDDTLPVVRGLTYPGLTLVRNTVGRGLLNAIRAGFAAANADVVIVTMADLSDDVAVANEMVRLIEEQQADVVCASRYMRGGKQIGGPWLKSMLSRVGGLTLHFLAGFPTHDATNAFRAYRRTVLERFPIESTGGIRILAGADRESARGGIQSDRGPGRVARSRRGRDGVPVMGVVAAVSEVVLVCAHASASLSGGQTILSVLRPPGQTGLSVLHQDDTLIAFVVIRMRTYSVVLLITLLTSAATADTKQVLHRWNGWMAESASHLKSGDHKAALKLCNRTIKEMIDQLGPGDASTEMFGTVLTYKAIAHAGLREQEEAVWYWQTVMNLYPQVANTDLSIYGEAGEFLKNNMSSAELASPEGDFITPVLRKKTKPKFPHGAHYFGVTGELVVQVVVTPDGRVQSPAIVQALPAPTLSYVALEALRRWRFDPATAGGTPVPYLFTLTINYKD